MRGNNYSDYLIIGIPNFSILYHQIIYIIKQTKKRFPSGQLCLIVDKEQYFRNFYKCKNHLHGCQIRYHTEIEMSEHSKKCKLPRQILENPTTSQIELGASVQPLQRAIELGYIKKTIENNNFIFYDLESCATPVNYSKGKTVVENVHCLISIAANSFVNNVHTQRVWTVENSSVEATRKCVQEFLKFCIDEANRMSIDPDLNKAVFKLQEKIGNNPFATTRNVQELTYIRNTLQKLQELCVFGYNSSHFDMALLMPYINDVFNDLNYTTTSESRVLKKGKKYLSVQFGKLHFKDILLFSTPMKLDRYLKTWTTDQKKYCYPYELFKNIEEIRKCIQFPPYSTFETRMSRPDIELYDECKKFYEYHYNLELGNPKKWHNFEDYLKFYNLQDVHPTAQAMINQFKVFIKNFGTNPMQSLSLPSYAKNVMYDLYNKDSPSTFTFSDPEVAKLFRQHIVGGLCNLYKRNATTVTNSNVPRAARFSIKGRNS